MPDVVEADRPHLTDGPELEPALGAFADLVVGRLLDVTAAFATAPMVVESFRADLYYRLGVFTIDLPPLRERGGDIDTLVRHYVRRFSHEMRREVLDVAPEALARSRTYSWPGNVRELQSVLRQALLQASGTILLPHFLPDLPDFDPASEAGGPVAASVRAFDLDAFIRQRMSRGATGIYSDTHEEVDRLLLVRAIEHTHGNLRNAAQLLGISRQTMRMKLRALGLRVSHSIDSDADPSA